MNLKNTIKGQSLPLNTIVIAILVIIVLLVIVVFFASNIGGGQDDINTLKGCSVENAAVASLGYTWADKQLVSKDNQVCSRGSKIFVVPPKNEINGAGVETSNVWICCGEKPNDDNNN